MKKLRDYLKVADAAEFLGVSQTTLRKWADDGQIPMYVNKANGDRLFLQNDLENFLNGMAKPVNRPRQKPKIE
jgi:excisionase family DNA binding protein